MNQSLITKEKKILDNRLKIGNSIKELREKRGYSQEEIANILEVKTITISKIENGKFSYNIDYLSRLASILNFDFDLVEKK